MTNKMNKLLIVYKNGFTRFLFIQGFGIFGTIFLLLTLIRQIIENVDFTKKLIVNDLITVAVASAVFGVVAWILMRIILKKDDLI